jgi:hypothetical protein
MDSPYPNASLTDEGRRASYPYNMHRYQAANNAPSPGTVLKYVTGREWVAVAGAAAASLPLGLAAGTSSFGESYLFIFLVMVAES